MFWCPAGILPPSPPSAVPPPSKREALRVASLKGPLLEGAPGEAGWGRIHPPRPVRRSAQGRRGGRPLHSPLTYGGTPYFVARLHTFNGKKGAMRPFTQKNSSGAAPWSCLKVMDGYGVDSDSRIRYPTPTSVKMYSGFAGFFSSFLRIFASTARRFWVLSETFAPQISRRRKS